MLSYVTLTSTPRRCAHGQVLGMMSFCAVRAKGAYGVGCTHSAQQDNLHDALQPGVLLVQRNVTLSLPEFVTPDPQAYSGTWAG